MARKLRLEYEGAIYHVMSRGDKGDPKKVKIALRLRRESTMTLKWIAQRLQMGSWTNVLNCLATTMK